MDENSSAYIQVSLRDGIGSLGLSTRSHNALRRAGIRTVGELVQLTKAGHLLDIRNIGWQSAGEIEGCLSRVRLADAEQSKVDEAGVCPSDDITAQRDAEILTPVAPSLPRRVLRWQAGLVEKQISAGLLHRKAIVSGNPITYWISAIDNLDRDLVYETMAGILGASLNICEELSFLLRETRSTHITILLSRYGFERRTYEEIGAELGMTRARASQIHSKLRERIEGSVKCALAAQPVGDAPMVPSLLRIQSALLIAKDMTMDIAYESWAERIQTSGLVGDWISDKYISVDPIELMLAVCRALSDSGIRELRIPDNLRYATELAVLGTPSLPAKMMHIRTTIPRKIEKLITKHARHCGGVHARWLSKEMEKELAQVRDVLQALGYRALSTDWFALGGRSDACTIAGYDVFHHALRKMFLYCGPLSIEEVCSGIRQAVSRTSFPVPPPDVMERIMRIYGYQSEDNLHWWDGEADEGLSASEMIVMKCLKQRGPVVHHSELAQAFVDSELSLPALYSTLKRSPVFERMGIGLYKLRGRRVAREDIARAEAAGEQVPVDLEVVYDKSGRVIVSATLSVIAVGMGVIFCNRFPNLSGKWDCYVDGNRCGKLIATENEFRRLRRPLESLGCGTGDRLKFTFDTWDRTVAIERVVGNYARR